MPVVEHDLDLGVNCVALDLATFPDPCFAVVYRGKLVPMRFATAVQGYEHLALMQASKPRERSAAAREAAAEGRATV